VRHAKEVLDLKTVIAERDDRLNETRENALALESDVNTVGPPPARARGVGRELTRSARTRARRTGARGSSTACWRRRARRTPS